MGSDESFFQRWARRKAQVERPPAAAAPDVPLEDAAVAVRAPLPQGAVAAQGPAVPPEPAQTKAEDEASPPAPTLDEARALTPQDDFRRFVSPQVDPQVRNTALKRLFADPHFNVMDRLDIYIDDYGKPDPLPAGMLRQMAQSAALGLFTEAPAPPPAIDTASASAAPNQEPPEVDTASAAPEDPWPAGEGNAPLPDDPALARPAPPRADAHALEGPADEDPDLRLQPHDAAGHGVDRPHAGGDARRER